MAGCGWRASGCYRSANGRRGGLFSEINDNSVAILLTYGTARILLAGDAEANEEEYEEEYMANGPYIGPLTIINVEKLHTHSEPTFRALLPSGKPSDVQLALG